MKGSSGSFGFEGAGAGEMMKFSGVVTVSSGMLGRWARSLRDVEAKRRGFFAGGAGKCMVSSSSRVEVESNSAGGADNNDEILSSVGFS